MELLAQVRSTPAAAVQPGPGLPAAPPPAPATAAALDEVLAVAPAATAPGTATSPTAVPPSTATAAPAAPSTATTATTPATPVIATMPAAAAIAPCTASAPATAAPSTAATASATAASSTAAAPFAITLPSSSAAASAALPLTKSITGLQEKRRRGTSVGMLLLNTESESNPSIPTFYFTLDGDLALSDFRERVSGSLGKFERFRSYVRDGWFIDDGSFSAVDHVSELTAADLGGPPTQETLRQYLENSFATALDARKPLWEMKLIRDYRVDGKPTTPPQTVVIARVHHVLVDGTAGMRILGAMSDEFADGSLTNEAAQNAAREAVEKVQASAQAKMPCGPLGFSASVCAVLGKYAGACFRPEPATPFRGDTTSRRSIAWTLLDASSSLEVARARGFTLNDLWMSALAAAMGGYLRSRGRPTAGLELTAGMPVSLHPPILPPNIGNSAGNKFGFLTIPLPLDEFDAREERLQSVHLRMQTAKDRPEALVSNALSVCAGCLPSPLVNCALASAGNSRTSTIVSNVRGPPSALHVAGLKLSSLYGFLPTPPGVALGVGIGTYANTLCLSVCCDRGLLGDSSSELLQMMLDEYRALCGTVGGAAS